LLLQQIEEKEPDGPQSRAGIAEETEEETTHDARGRNGKLRSGGSQVRAEIRIFEERLAFEQSPQQALFSCNLPE